MAAAVAEFLIAAKAFAVATVDDAGNPRNRFFSTVIEFNGHLLIATGGDRPVVAELTKNGGVAIAALNGTPGEFIRIHGKVVPFQDITAKVQCFEKYPCIVEHWTGPEDPNCQLFAIVGEAIIHRPGPAGPEETTIALN
jgi:uncharacterized pyridoxamine 5'-phosphate oxidase family protein